MDLENNEQKPAVVVKRDERAQGLNPRSIPSQSPEWQMKKILLLTCVSHSCVREWIDRSDFQIISFVFDNNVTADKRIGAQFHGLARVPRKFYGKDDVAFA